MLLAPKYNAILDGISLLQYMYYMFPQRNSGIEDLDPSRNQALIPCNQRDFLMHKRQRKSIVFFYGIYTIIDPFMQLT